MQSWLSPSPKEPVLSLMGACATPKPICAARGWILCNIYTCEGRAFFPLVCTTALLFLIFSNSLSLVNRSRQQLFCDNSSIFCYHCSVCTQDHLHCTVQTSQEAYHRLLWVAAAPVFSDMRCPYPHRGGGTQREPARLTPLQIPHFPESIEGC